MCKTFKKERFFFAKTGTCIFMPPFEEEGHIALHVPIGRPDGVRSIS
jgi:hypothetical protein